MSVGVKARLRKGKGEGKRRQGGGKKDKKEAGMAPEAAAGGQAGHSRPGGGQDTLPAQQRKAAKKGQAGKREQAPSRGPPHCTQRQPADGRVSPNPRKVAQERRREHPGGLRDLQRRW